MLADAIPKIAEQEMLARGDTGYAKYHPRPSNSGPEKCIRQMVYHAMGAPPKQLPGRSILTFDDSSWHEELTLNWLAKHATIKPHSQQLGVTIPNAFPWRKGQPDRNCRDCRKQGDPGKVKAEDAHGHMDFIVQDIQKTDWLVEHKALNHFGFNRIWEKEAYPLDYLTQMVFYFRGLAQIQETTGQGILLIKNKNTAQYIEFGVHYDLDADELIVTHAVRSDGETYEPKFTLENVWKNAIDKFEAVDNFVGTKTLPRRPYPYQTDFPCSYCAWEITCWDGYEAEVAALGEGVVKDEEFRKLCAMERKLALEVSVKESEKKVLEVQRKAVKQKIYGEMLNRDIKEAQVTGPSDTEFPGKQLYTVNIEISHREGHVVAPSTFEQITVKDYKEPKEKKIGTKEPKPI